MPKRITKTRELIAPQGPGREPGKCGNIRSKRLYLCCDNDENIGEPKGAPEKENNITSACYEPVA